MGHFIILFDPQIDLCEEALSSVDALARSADAKVTAPSAEVVVTFHGIIKQCTQCNHKKRCSVDEVP